MVSQKASDQAWRDFTKKSSIYRGAETNHEFRGTGTFRFPDIQSAAQSRVESAIEATLNVGTGFLLSWAVWMWLIPVIWFDINPGDPRQAFLLTTVFTVTSFARSYFWRRFFATSVHKRIHQWLNRSAPSDARPGSPNPSWSS